MTDFVAATVVPYLAGETDAVALALILWSALYCFPTNLDLPVALAEESAKAVVLYPHPMALNPAVVDGSCVRVALVDASEFYCATYLERDSDDGVGILESEIVRAAAGAVVLDDDTAHVA